jgi:hypothetical protein
MDPPSRGIPVLEHPPLSSLPESLLPCRGCPPHLCTCCVPWQLTLFLRPAPQAPSFLQGKYLNPSADSTAWTPLTIGLSGAHLVMTIDPIHHPKPPNKITKLDHDDDDTRSFVPERGEGEIERDAAHLSFPFLPSLPPIPCPLLVAPHTLDHGGHEANTTPTSHTPLAESSWKMPWWSTSVSLVSMRCGTATAMGEAEMPSLPLSSTVSARISQDSTACLMTRSPGASSRRASSTLFLFSMSSTFWVCDCGSCLELRQSLSWWKAARRTRARPRISLSTLTVGYADLPSLPPSFSFHPSLFSLLLPHLTFPRCPFPVRVCQSCER